jgi:hypothetical protein
LAEEMKAYDMWKRLTEELDVKKSFSATFNPYSQNNRLKKVKTSPSRKTRSELQKMLENPADNEQALRAISWYFYNSITQIMKETHLYSDILSYRWWVEPNSVIKAKVFKNEYEQAVKWIKSIDPKKTFREIVLEVMREGKVAYAVRDTNSGMVLQRLPSDWWKVVYRTPYGYQLAFNFMYFITEGVSVDYFPESFREIYNQLNKVYDPSKNKIIGKVPDIFQVEKRYQKFLYWAEIPIKDAFVFSFDETVAEAVPPLMAQFINANDLDSYKLLQQQLLEIPLNQILTATVPLQKNNKSGAYLDDTAITPELCVLYENSIRASLPDNIDFVAAPFEDFKSFSFDNAQTRDNIVGDSISNFYNEALGGLINTSDKPSMSAIKTQQVIESRFIDVIYGQFMKFVNMHLKIMNFDSCSFVMSGNVFTDGERFKEVKQMIDSGNTNMYLEYLSFGNQDLVTAKSSMELVDAFGIYDMFRVPPTSFTTSSDEESNGGRPSLDQEDMTSDGSIDSAESGANTSEGRGLS